jgi:hypothetical protein
VPHDLFSQGKARDFEPQRVGLELAEAIHVENSEIGFYGRVVSPEVSPDRFWVRLNILNLTHAFEQTFDPSDYTTWAFENGIMRSQAKRLNADGSFLLLGRDPPRLHRSLRRYAIEIAIDPPGDSWPLLGKQELLPVAMHWVGDADAGQMHGPHVIRAQAPYRVKTRVVLHPEMRWMHSGLRLQTRLLRPEEPPSPWDGIDRFRSDRRLEFSGSLATDMVHEFYLSSVGPNWQLQQRVSIRSAEEELGLPDSSPPA